MKMSFHSHANKTHFPIKGFALDLALKQRQNATRKWPIARQVLRNVALRNIALNIMNLFILFRYNFFCVFLFLQACKKGHKDVVEVLLKYGVDTKAQTTYDLTAEQIASKNQHFQIQNLLADHEERSVQLFGWHECIDPFVDLTLMIIHLKYNQYSSRK